LASAAHQSGGGCHHERHKEAAVLLEIQQTMVPDDANCTWQCHNCSYCNDHRTFWSWFLDVNVNEDVAARMCIMCDAFQHRPCTVIVEEFD
jgi:hypothetical protein